MSDRGDILTVREVADLFKINRKTVTTWIYQRKLPAFKTLGGHYRLYRKDVDDALKQGTLGTTR